MPVSLRRLNAVNAGQLEDLAEVLHDCVHGGASVSFMLPFSLDEARAFWRGVAEGVARGERALVVAEVDGRLRGTVQLVLAQPPNQPHRADLAKMLVHRQARRLGLGALLLAEAERLARAEGKTLLVLDTASPEAERLYTRGGWVPAGVVPGYALLPQGGLCDTRYFYKALA
ncbi:GNAT family N-acetyltransferase [Rubrivivax rivuli]|uniref:GNAT family N-acetyltransferase n=1 Tax=Rubrivivax rivuli TaxID=1862385 RepID=A0A437RAC0_9BURK|nr:GNAT family N-acetyltransferase [Rubrivivax rivuli]RVU43738.1 GNAT family N-acetyltransferase [Rubrivivax rivuli]